MKLQGICNTLCLVWTFFTTGLLASISLKKTRLKKTFSLCLCNCKKKNIIARQQHVIFQWDGAPVCCGQDSRAFHCIPAHWMICQQSTNDWISYFGGLITIHLK